MIMARAWGSNFEENPQVDKKMGQDRRYCHHQFAFLCWHSEKYLGAHAVHLVGWFLQASLYLKLLSSHGQRISTVEPRLQWVGALRITQNFWGLKNLPRHFKFIRRFWMRVKRWSSHDGLVEWKKFKGGQTTSSTCLHATFSSIPSRDIFLYLVFVDGGSMN